MPAMLARIGRYAFNVTKASFTESRTMFAGKNPDEIRRFWDEVRPRGGDRARGRRAEGRARRSGRRWVSMLRQRISA